MNQMDICYKGAKEEGMASKRTISYSGVYNKQQKKVLGIFEGSFETYTSYYNKISCAQ